MNVPSAATETSSFHKEKEKRGSRERFTGPTERFISIRRCNLYVSIDIVDGGMSAVID